MTITSKHEAQDLAGALMWLRANGGELARAAKGGDRDALGVMAAYEAVHGDQLNVVKQDEFLTRIKAFIGRDLRVAERMKLAETTGYKASDIEQAIAAVTKHS